MWYYAGRADEIFIRELGREFVITNAVAERKYASKHTRRLAVDGRTNDQFDFTAWKHKPKMLNLIRRLRKELDPRGYDTILEPDELSAFDVVKRFRDETLQRLIGHHDREKITPDELLLLKRKIAPHVHAEYDPKQADFELWPEVE
jgi:hypothetical protein